VNCGQALLILTHRAWAAAAAGCRQAGRASCCCVLGVMMQCNSTSLQAAHYSSLRRTCRTASCFAPLYLCCLVLESPFLSLYLLCVCHSACCAFHGIWLQVLLKCNLDFVVLVAPSLRFQCVIEKIMDMGGGVSYAPTKFHREVCHFVNSAKGINDARII
jgi:hypothetical protein